MYRLRSIRWRLVASYVLLTLLSVSLVGALALSLIRQHAERQETEYLTANATTIARQAGPLMWPVVHWRELQQLAQTSAFLGNMQVRFLNTQKQPLADSGPRAEVDEFAWVLTPNQDNQLSGDVDQAFIMSLLLGKTGVIAVNSNRQPLLDQLPPGTKFMMVRRIPGPWGSRFIFTPGSTTSDTHSEQQLVADDSVPRSDSVIQVPISTSDRLLGYVELSGAPDFGSQTMVTANQAFLLAAAGATLVAAIVGLFVGRGLTAPLNNLAIVANRMSSGDLSARAPVSSHSEIGKVAQQFNQMAERMQASFAELAAERDTLRRFVADASHELRTPITALRTFNELLQGPAADDPATRAEFLHESQAQIERLQWITNNLLDLSRLDAGLAHLDLADHDIGEILQASAAAFKRLAQEHGISLALKWPDPALTIRCDRTRMELALTNLIDNALKFTPAGGHVEVGADNANSAVHLWVQDDGPGIDPTDLPHIFDRFYRGKNGNTRGSGLGLALVKSVTLAHGGQVSVQSNAGLGSRFVIELQTR